MEVIGNGSVVQRDKSKPRSRCRKWELSVIVRENGRKRPRTRAFQGTYTQAAEALEDFKDELRGTRAVSNMPFAEWADIWHARREGSGLFAYKTMANEAVRVRRLKAEFGDSMLSDMTTEAVGHVYASWSLKHTKNTVNIMAETLDTMLGAAEKDGAISENPCKKVKPPKSSIMRERTVLSAADMDGLAGKLDCRDGRQRAVLLCMFCGLRKAECIALRWSDWDGESVHVNRADDGRGKDKPPKTGAGVRCVPAPAWLADELNEVSEAHDEPMCPGPDGRRMTGPSFGSWWGYARKRFGVDCTLHELRHSYLTRLASAGVHPRIMMRLAGHDTMAVCMEIYTHVSNDMQRNAVAATFGDFVRVSCGFSDKTAGR